MKSIINRAFQTFNEIGILNHSQISHIPEGLKAFLIGYLFNEKNQSLLFLVEDNLKAETMEQNLLDLGFPAASMPYYDVLPYETEKPSFSLLAKRIGVLDSILKNEKKIYIIPVKSLLFPVIRKEDLMRLTLSLSKGKTINRDSLRESLSIMGYERSPQVERKGEFVFRGEIIDIYSAHLAYPVRIELFDDEIEAIKLFDSETQTSIKGKTLDHVDILPVYEFRALEKEIQGLKTRLSTEYPPTLISKFEDGIKLFPFDMNLIPFFYANHTITDFFKSCGHDFFSVSEDFKNVQSIERNFLKEIKELFYSSFNIDKVKINPSEYFVSLEQVDLKLTHEFIGLTGETDSFSLANVFTASPFYQGKIEIFKKHLEEWKNYQFKIGCFYEGQIERMKEIFPSLEPVLSATLQNGWIDHHGKLAFILEQEIFGKRYLSQRKRTVMLPTSPIESFSDLEKGDYVVHINHGVGCFSGIEKIAVLGKFKDYIKINYADENTLYVPVEQVFMVHKYMGGSDASPKLDTLGGKSWEKKRERLKKRMEEMAEELAILYEKRKQIKGFKFPTDSKWQEEFEAGFPFEETPDQLTAIEEVKKDMEIEYPMDRLICGDVGYGKTEVAMRACFKAVSAGKQVAVLVPTTLLAEQHYQNFLERFEGFPVSIQMLSRLVPAKQTKETLKGISDGSVDILIGTHKILSETVLFKNLGLLVIDEEQRFGVKHKERIKQMKASIDVLTLSATPIPRTLYMGLSNLRDMSLITTPPVSRIPVKTKVMPFEENTVVQAIRREKDRGGQIFMVHNRVKTIEQFADFIRRLVPGISIAVGHAQMSAIEIENIFLDFVHKKYDILISTTIIENGIDIPNVNTIMIDRPELMGLSELYQLRGRVGRSDKQAYAYLFYDPVNGISPNVQRRLEVIEEHTELGSGFKVAMKDLEIRGAGNLLGGEQSGFIGDVGIELYAKMVKDVVQQVKSGILTEEIEPMIDLSFNGYFPDAYISDEKEKFSIYKIIMRASELEDVALVREQIQDRYGRIPETVENLMAVSRIKVLCKKMGIKELKETREGYQIEFFENKKINPAAVLTLIQNKKARISGNYLHFSRDLTLNTNPLNGMEEFLKILMG